eukprot:COSAG06_NODE_58250_length_277_cov_1.168539_1_plen_48_part_10
MRAPVSPLCGSAPASPRHRSVSPDVFSAEALLMELNEPSGSGSGSQLA